MKKSRYMEEQIIGRLKQHEAGEKMADLCREHGISAATFYGWKSKFGGMEVSEAQRLKAMEDKNRRLKLLVAELSLHGEALKAVIRKNCVRRNLATNSFKCAISLSLERITTAANKELSVKAGC